MLESPHWKLTESFGEAVENVLRVAKLNVNFINKSKVKVLFQIKFIMKLVKWACHISQ